MCIYIYIYLLVLDRLFFPNLEGLARNKEEEKKKEKREKMRSSVVLSTVAATWSSHASAARLYSAHSDGNVTSLALTDSGNGNYSLEVTSVTADCEANPAVLTLDKEHGALYCYDRGGSQDTVGSLNSFSISESDGALTRTSRVEAPYSGVWGEIVTLGDSGERVYVSAS